MIDKTQLEAYKTFIDPYQTEKDYLQDLLLYNIYKISDRELVFKGGTALSKVYRTDRFSEDIDFTLSKHESTDMDNVEKGITHIKGVLDGAASKLEYKNSYLEEPRANKFGTVSALLGIEGPRFTGRPSTLQQVRFEVSIRGSVLIKPKAISITPIYAGAQGYVAEVMDATEILSEKIRAVLSKGRYHKERDLYDMYVLLKKRFMPDQKTLETKFKEVDREFSKNEFERAVLKIKDSWLNLKPLVQHTLEDYESVGSYVINAISNADLD